MNKDVDAQDLGELRRELSDLVKLHPPRDWSPGLLMGVSGLIRASMFVHGLEGLSDLIEEPRLRLVT